MAERLKQTHQKIKREYYEIVRDPELLDIARSESIDTFREKYTACYEVIKDESHRQSLIQMAVESMDSKWNDALQKYNETTTECSLGNTEACEMRSDKETTLALFLTIADEERLAMGALPFVVDSRYQKTTTQEAQLGQGDTQEFPAPTTHEITLIESAAD